MVWDGARSNVLLFGGVDRQDLRDTWIWDGTSWRPRVVEPAPFARHAHAMVFDAARARVVMFGGYSLVAPLNDTWEWDGAAWIALKPAHSPPALRDHAMAYDPLRKRTVLFGGRAGHDNGNMTNDTWEWDGQDWTLVKTRPGPGPAPCYDHALVFDAGRGKVALLGGNDPKGFPLSDAWEYDGTWKLRPALGKTPWPRTEFVSLWDPVRRAIVIFGGAQRRADESGDSWVSTADGWTRADVAPGIARIGSAAVFDEVRGAVLLFGGLTGYEPLADTWRGFLPEGPRRPRDSKPGIVVAGPAAGPLAGTRWVRIPGDKDYVLSTGRYSTPSTGFEVLTTEVTGAMFQHAGLDNQQEGRGAGAVPRTGLTWTQICGDGARFVISRGSDNGNCGGGWLASLNEAEAVAGRGDYWYRLPSEQEWEAAARGDASYAATGAPHGAELTAQAWCRTSAATGDATDGVDVTAASLVGYALFNGVGGVGARPVATKASCGGLYDMFGNAMEWTSSQRTAGLRTVCGGAWFASTMQASATARTFISPADPSADRGFRIVRVKR